MLTFDQGKNKDIFNLINGLFMLIIVVIMLYPLYYVGIISISDSQQDDKGRVHWYPIKISFAA